MLFLFLKVLFIHEREREREAGRDIGRGRSRLYTGSIQVVGLDPRPPGSLGSRPEPKTGAQPLSHPGVPVMLF